MEIERIALGAVRSTNDHLNAMRPKPGKAILATAEYQEGGRGQGANRWESELGKNLLFSFLVAPEGMAARDQFVLSMANAVALAHALGRYAAVEVKWPNDIYAGGRKLAGTLIEARLMGGRVAAATVGTGVNVNQAEFPPGLPGPVSLAQLAGRELPRGEVMDGIATAFIAQMERADRGDYAGISADYHSLLYRRSGFHRFADAAGEFTARIVSVAQCGRITLEDSCGRERNYVFKEIRWL